MTCAFSEPGPGASRTALITPRFPPQCCGVGDFTGQLARAVAARGEDVVVLTEPAAGPRPEGIAVVETPLRGWRNLPRGLRAIAAAGAARVQLEYSSYGWSRWGASFAVNALAVALRLRGVPLTLACHEMSIEWSLQPRSLVSGLLQRLHFLLLFLAARDVVTNTPERVAQLRRWLPWRTGHVHFRPNASNIPVTAISAARRAELRRAEGADENTLVIATFGNFHPAKNYEAVIEAVAQLQSRLPLRLWLLGDDREIRPRYLARVRERARAAASLVSRPGHLPPKRISELLQAADLFVLPQSDGHLTRSGAFMAAAAHGLPVIAVRNDANQPGFAHGESVWLVERSTTASFAQAIERLHANPMLRAALGTSLHRLYLQRFDWPQTAAATAQLWSQQAAPGGEDSLTKRSAPARTAGSAAELSVTSPSVTAKKESVS